MPQRLYVLSWIFILFYLLFFSPADFLLFPHFSFLTHFSTTTNRTCYIPTFFTTYHRTTNGACDIPNFRDYQLLLSLFFLSLLTSHLLFLIPSSNRLFPPSSLLIPAFEMIATWPYGLYLLPGKTIKLYTCTAKNSFLGNLERFERHSTIRLNYFSNSQFVCHFILQVIFF